MTPISQAKIKVVNSLKRKKYRKKHGLYVIEGLKSCRTVMEAGFEPLYIICQGGLSLTLEGVDLFEAESSVMKSLSSFQTIPDVIGVFQLPDPREIVDATKSSLVVFLDRIQDPGNLGTIIRTADWFGVRHIILNEGCADVFNPKTIQSAMGSHVQVSIYNTEFSAAKSQLKDHIWLSMDMAGDHMNDVETEEPKVLVIGNEGQGIAAEILDQSDRKLCIPGDSKRAAESLNAAIAAAIAMEYFTT